MTLVELMAVVVIVGVLAAIGSLGYRRYVNASRAAEVGNVLGMISAGEGAYYEETYKYYTVSSSLSNYYPMTTPGRKLYAWQQSRPEFAKFRTLGVMPSSPVAFGYAVVAGTASDSIPALGLSGSYSLPSPTGHWFVAKAVGDVDGNGVQSRYIASSFTSEIYAENDGE